MIHEEFSTDSRTRRTLSGAARVLLALKVDGPLAVGLALTAAFGLVVLYSASAENTSMLVRTVLRLALGIIIMLSVARISPNLLRRASPWLYGLGIVLLLAVAAVGHVHLGAKRWLDLGPIHFQPSELMKIAVPMMCAWYLHERPLPPRLGDLGMLGLIILAPVGLVAKEPDLGTAALITAAGAVVVFLAGLRVRAIIVLLLLATVGAALGLRFMHGYQRERLLTFLNPEAHPLGAGYHIIQSQIAVGSGGVFGKGWMAGSQAQLDFLPERTTDFIFAVIGEEFGLLGLLVLLTLYAYVIARSIYLAMQCPDTFARLLGGSIALT
ncbi:MAG: FtsW/RodA/SpoVE family cell cycle protein, partial [Pseudomonadota bacterium]|nr:FtsW/RodA/SpoVE family cell cycle protein [Pseudomonadota bacterium]